MNKFVAAMLIAVAPTISLAGGHSAFSGHGTGVTTNTNVMEGVTGVHVHNTTNDVWIYDNPPEGFPAAVLKLLLIPYFKSIPAEYPLNGRLFLFKSKEDCK